MNKEVRAVVLGLFVVVLAALALSSWNRPAAEFHRIKNFRVEVKEKDGDAMRTVTFNIPTNLVARIARLAPMREISGNLKADWGRGEINAREILDAADQSKPDSPGVIKKDDATIEVATDGRALDITVKDDWDKTVHIRLPRAIVEGLSDDHRMSTSEVLRRLDELDPGDVVVIKSNGKEVTITAVPRRGIHIS